MESSRRSAHRVLTAVSCVIACASISTGAAGAAPTGPVGNGELSGPVIAPDVGSIRNPKVVMSTSGDATGVWQQQEISTSQWMVGFAQIDSHLAVDFPVITGGLTSASDVQPDPPAVAAGPNGSAALAVHLYDGSHWLIRTAMINSDGTPGSLKTLSATTKDSTHPQIAMNASGKGIAAWLTDETGIGGWVLHWCTYSASGKAGPIQSANAKTTTIAATPSVSISPSGVATLAFRLRDVAKSKYSIQALRISSVGKVTKNVTVVAAGTDMPTDLTQATGLGGTTAFAWVAPATSGSVVKVGLLSPTSSLKVTSSLTGGWAGTQSKPKVAVSSSGAVAVVWQEEGPDVTQIYARRVSASGSLGQQRLLTAASYDAYDPAISCGADGSAIVSWTRYSAGPEGPPINQLVRLSTRGGLSILYNMNSGTGGETAGLTANASDPAGRAIILSQLEGAEGSAITAFSDY